MTGIVQIDLPKDTWTNISNSLIQGTNYTLQNRGSREIKLVESASPPTDEMGFNIYPSEVISVRRDETVDIYAFPEDSVGMVILNEAT